MFFRFFWICLFSGIPLTAFAQNQVTKDFSNSASKLVASLRDVGFHKLGQVDLDGLANDIQNISVTASPTAAHASPTGCYRLSAEWRDRNNSISIVVNSTFWKETPTFAKGPLALHEYLGAEGDFRIEDQYQCSTALSLAASPIVRKVLSAAEFKRMLLNVKDVCSDPRGLVSVAGGTTGVGGGGDARGTLAKMLLQRHYLSEIASASPKDRLNKFNDFLGSFYTRFDICNRQSIKGNN